MEEFLSELGIHDEGSTTPDGNYVIDFDSVDDYNRAFGKLDRADDLDETEDSSVVNSSTSSIIYTNEDYIITLSADFDNDKYTLVVQKIKEDN